MTDRTARILVIDDDRQARLKLTRQLEAAGHSVLDADGGAAAFAALAEGAFDLILLDILMPDVDGYEVLRRLKADERLSRIPVIVVSALEEAENEGADRGLGASAYLTKPVDAEILIDKVRRCLA